jgi:hypothetical protein
MVPPSRQGSKLLQTLLCDVPVSITGVLRNGSGSVHKNRRVCGSGLMVGIVHVIWRA